MIRVNRIKQVASSTVFNTKTSCNQQRFLHRDHVHHHPLCGCAQGTRLFLLQQRHQGFSESNNQKRFIQKVNEQQQQGPVGDYAFEIPANQIKFGMQYGIELCVCVFSYMRTFIYSYKMRCIGPGVLKEVGMDAQELGLQWKRVALFTDKHVAQLEAIQVVKNSLLKYGKVSHVEIFDDVQIEPTDISFKRAIQFAKEGKFDGYVSLGGGSVMDTCKAANLYATYPSEHFLDYVNAPIGKGLPCPGPLKPHIACPTTSGTGSEATGFSIFDFLEMKAKTGIADKYLRPNCALVDPEVTRTLPSTVVAASGFDTLSHGLESYTAISYKKRKNYPFVFGVSKGRPQNQGSNPYADFGCLEVLKIVSENIVRAVNDANDFEARTNMMFASTLAGTAMGSAGVHLPHGMSYAVTGLNQSFKMSGYPADEPLVPHGVSVILNAPSVFKYTAKYLPDRHLTAARILGANVKNASPEDAGHILHEQLVKLMKETKVPSGLRAIGYSEEDIDALVQRTMPQKRVVNNAPFDVKEEDLQAMFRGAMQYWN